MDAFSKARATEGIAHCKADWSEGDNLKGKAVEFKGSPQFEEFWGYLENESPRGVAVVVAAFFDEKLGALLGEAQNKSFFVRINEGLAQGWLTPNEHDDLHTIRGIRNSFAHNLRANSFDSAKTQQVNGLKTWQVAVGELPQYGDLFPTAKDRLLYVAGVIAVRLNHRTSPGGGPLPEPSFLDTTAWPPVTDR